MLELNGKNVLITGAGRGIGQVTALKLASRGARVAVNDLPDLKETLNVVNEINSLGHEAILAVGDVSQEETVKEIIRQVNEKWGRIDILINNHSSGIDPDPKSSNQHLRIRKERGVIPDCAGTFW